MATREELLTEAQRRGISLDRRQEIEVEAMRRGLDVPKPRSFDPRQTVLETGMSIASSVVAEPLAGLAGFVTAPFAGADKATEVIDKTREALTFKPRSQEGDAALENVGKFVQGATEIVRKPVAGLTGLGTLALGGGAEQAASNVQSIEQDGIGPFFGDRVLEATNSPELATIISTIPVAVATVLGVKGANKVSPKIKGVSDDMVEVLTRKGIDPGDASPANIAKIDTEIKRFTAEQQVRIDAFKDVGINNPTRAQITRSADDFQTQQELTKKSGRVRNEIERQEADLSNTLDDAVTNTGGQQVTSGSTVVDEVVGRSTAVDSKIGELYKAARDRSQGAANVDFSRFAKRVADNLDSDAATNGLFSAVRGELRRRGVINKKGEVIGKIDVDGAD